MQSETQSSGVKHVGEHLSGVLSRISEISRFEHSEKKKIDSEGVKRMYATVYHGLTKNYGLSPIESLLASTVISLSQKKGYAYASQSTYAYLLNVTPATVNTAFKNLCKSKVLEKYGKTIEGTVKWRMTPKVEDELRFIRKGIEKAKQKT